MKRAKINACAVTTGPGRKVEADCEPATTPASTPTPGPGRLTAPQPLSAHDCGTHRLLMRAARG